MEIKEKIIEKHKDDKEHLELRDELNFDWLAFYNAMEQKFIKKQNKIKIDVCMQVRFKFDDFINYILKNA